jgi:hypothetical protein
VSAEQLCLAELYLFIIFYLDDYRGEIGKMCEWYHHTLAGGTLALDAPLMLYVIRRFLRQVESRTVGGDVCALRDAMVELVAGEDQEPPNELNYLTEDDLPSEIPSSDVVLRELEEFLRQNQQDSGPNSGSDDPSDSA